jgi:hypothetical protein
MVDMDEDAFTPGYFLENCLRVNSTRIGILQDRRLGPPKLPPWSTAIVPGATMMDPYLGLRRLQGPVTYRGYANLPPPLIT